MNIQTILFLRKKENYNYFSTNKILHSVTRKKLAFFLYYMLENIINILTYEFNIINRIRYLFWSYNFTHDGKESYLRVILHHDVIKLHLITVLIASSIVKVSATKTEQSPVYVSKTEKSCRYYLCGHNRWLYTFYDPFSKHPCSIYVT